MLSRDGREVKTGTQALGVQNDFYTVTAADGRKDSSVEEQLLRDRDGRGAEALKRLLADGAPVDDETRIEFGQFLGLQWLRGRMARQISEEFHDTFQKFLVTAGLDLDPLDEAQDEAPSEGAGPPPFVTDTGIEVPRLGQLPEELKAVLRNTDAYKFPLPQEHSILQMIEGVPDVAEIFIDARWVLVRAESARFLTSDEPISLYREPTPQNRHFGLGPGNADMLQVPLSPDHCLIVDRQDREGPDLHLEASARFIREANMLTLHGVWRQLFRHPDSDPFPPAPPLADRFVEIV